MKVNTLAGSRRPAPPVLPPAPQFRWTFKTWVVKVWSHSKNRPLVEGTERTVTVIATNEEEAKARIEAALPSLPLSDFNQYGSIEATYERRWSLEAEVVEVTP